MIKRPYIVLYSSDGLYYMILLTQCQGKIALSLCGSYQWIAEIKPIDLKLKIFYYRMA